MLRPEPQFRPMSLRASAASAARPDDHTTASRTAFRSRVCRADLTQQHTLRANPGGHQTNTRPQPIHDRRSFADQPAHASAPGQCLRRPSAQDVTLSHPP